MYIVERITANVVNILAVQQIRGIGAAWVAKHIKGGESCGLIVDMVNHTCKSKVVSVQAFTARRERVLRMLERESASFDSAMAFCDADWSHFTANVRGAQQPLILFCRGNADLLRGICTNVAVIGTQAPESDSVEFEHNLVERLSRCGVCIVSGLAYGCDAVAHSTAVDNGAPTIAFLPSQLSNIMPVGNRDLAEQIVANGGLLVSEYYNEPENRYDLNGRYAERDRLQAMFSGAVVLASGFEKKDGYAAGSRLAMRYANEFGRLRAVVYDEALHSVRKDFGLNKELASSDSSVITIDSQNVDAAIERILRACHKNIGTPQQLEMPL